MSLWDGHQKRELVTSSPQIPLLELRIFVSLRFPNLLALLLSPPPPFSLSEIAGPRGFSDDMNGAVFARVGGGVTVVSVHRRLHPVTIRKEGRGDTAEPLSDRGFLDDANVMRNLQRATAYSLPVKDNRNTYMEPRIESENDSVDRRGRDRFSLTCHALDVRSRPLARLPSSTWSSLNGDEWVYSGRMVARATH